MLLANALLLASVLLLAGTAVAQTPEEQARVLFREGNDLFARKMYLDALEKYRQARAVFPSYKIDLNIGTTLDALGRRSEAATYIERFLLQSAAAPEDTIAAAREKLEELRSKLGRVKVTTLLEGALILADGVSAGTAPLYVPVYLEPGEHRLEARKEGASPSSRTITVTAGQELSVDLWSPPTPPASAPVSRAPASLPSTRPAVRAPVVASKVTVSPPEPSAPDPRAMKRRRKTVWAWSSLAVGGALAITAAVLYGVGATRAKSAHDTYSRATEPAEIESDWKDVAAGNRIVMAGHVVAGAAAIGLGVSLYHFVTRPAVEKQPDARLTLVPLGAGASLQGSF